MPASDDGPDAWEERDRRGAAFLHGAREVPELSQAQIDRIEQGLRRAPPRARHPILSQALAALVILLVGGGALAVAAKSFPRLPLVGPLVDRLFAPRPARPGLAGGSARLPGRSPPPTETRAPAPPAARAPTLPPPAASGASAGPKGAASMTSPPPRPHRRQPEATSPSAVAAPATERDLERPPPALAPPAVGAVAEGGRALAGGAAAGSPALPAPAAIPEPPVAPAPPAAPAPAAALAPAAAPAPPAAPESAIVAESRSFASALERWHRAHDAKASLAALDAHERRYPYGELRIEAQLLRAEILLAGGAEREALALLDPLTLAGLPRGRELRTVRGELRIKLGRCAEGTADLRAVLAEGASDPLAQRARQALTHCP